MTTGERIVPLVEAVAQFGVSTAEATKAFGRIREALSDVGAMLEDQMASRDREGARLRRAVRRIRRENGVD